MVTITINGEERLYEDGIKYEIIAEEYQNHFTSPIALVTVNGKIRELMKRVDRDCELDFITYEDTIGHKAYVRSAIMLMMKAIKDVVGMEAATNVKVEFTIGPGYYCSCHGRKSGSSGTGCSSAGVFYPWWKNAGKRTLLSDRNK